MHHFELSTACKEEELGQDYKDCELLDTFTWDSNWKD